MNVQNDLNFVYDLHVDSLLAEIEILQDFICHKHNILMY
jgi:hypothetical protein